VSSGLRLQAAEENSSAAFSYSEENHRDTETQSNKIDGCSHLSPRAGIPLCLCVSVVEVAYSTQTGWGLDSQKSLSFSSGFVTVSFTTPFAAERLMAKC
jgi:hypothetical protein